MWRDRPFLGKGHWKQLKWVCQDGLGRVSGNYQGKAKSVSRVDGDSDMAPSGQLCVCVCVCVCTGVGVGGSEKKQLPLTAIFLWQKAASPALTMMPENSVLPHMSLVLFKMLSQLELRVSESQ